MKISVNVNVECRMYTFGVSLVLYIHIHIYSTLFPLELFLRKDIFSNKVSGGNFKIKEKFIVIHVFNFLFL